MRRRIFAFLLSVCLILGMVQAGWAESDDGLYEKLEKLWAEYGDRDFHSAEYEKLYISVIEQVWGPETADFARHPSLL